MNNTEKNRRSPWKKREAIIQNRVTPIYEGENKLASGITIEAESVEDRGRNICFYGYIYNVQPGVSIDYSTGEGKYQVINGEYQKID